MMYTYIKVYDVYLYQSIWCILTLQAAAVTSDGVSGENAGLSAALTLNK
jgi:hypothetical protein